MMDRSEETLERLWSAGWRMLTGDKDLYGYSCVWIKDGRVIEATGGTMEAAIHNAAARIGRSQP